MVIMCTLKSVGPHYHGNIQGSPIEMQAITMVQTGVIETQAITMVTHTGVPQTQPITMVTYRGPPLKHKPLPWYRQGSPIETQAITMVTDRGSPLKHKIQLELISQPEQK